ncbi:NADH dehydrogenase [ubiquinone] 1 beta subcomplex subunit 9 [Euwallacea similis]|uniref:NADH dehydrogenase [ubiquinone] 1 beta subcomplex subunit 9 n=1 Tax=Euwallacea similis TaxID=1736056 RepID=UPI00344EC867
MAVNLPSGLTTHTRKVQSLYKRAIRDLEAWYFKRDVFRYQATLMRKRFDDNKDIKDMVMAKSLLEEGEKELFKTLHWHPKKFPHSPGGVAYGRVVVPPDWVLDYWHPLEKAQYPEYFARREQRKKEFIKQWEQQYGKSTTFHH